MSQLPTLESIDRYCDAAPAFTAARVELGAFTLFINPVGWPYYARPTIDGPTPTTADVQQVLEVQRERGVPRSFEWVHERTPGLAEIMSKLGHTVHFNPLLALPYGAKVTTSSDVPVRLMEPADPDVGLVNAVASVGFASPGGAIGPESIDSLLPTMADRTPEFDAYERMRLERGITVTMCVESDGGPVSVGALNPVGDVAEICGIATLPAYRNRGYGSAVTAALAAHATNIGIRDLFLGAGDDRTARIYEGVGFVRVGTACEVEATPAHPPVSLSSA